MGSINASGYRLPITRAKTDTPNQRSEFISNLVKTTARKLQCAPTKTNTPTQSERAKKNWGKISTARKLQRAPTKTNTPTQSKRARKNWGKLSTAIRIISNSKKTNTKISDADVEKAKLAATLAKRFCGVRADKNQSKAKIMCNELKNTNNNRQNLNEWILKEKASSFENMEENSKPYNFTKKELGTIKEIIRLMLDADDFNKKSKEYDQLIGSADMYNLKAQEQIDEFKNKGACTFISKGVKENIIGRFKGWGRDGDKNFVLKLPDAINLIQGISNQKPSANITDVEKTLGFPPGGLGNIGDEFSLFIPKDLSKLELPSGQEGSSFSAHWMAGGRTEFQQEKTEDESTKYTGGLQEAVIDPIRGTKEEIYQQIREVRVKFGESGAKCCFTKEGDHTEENWIPINEALQVDKKSGKVQIKKGEDWTDYVFSD